VGAARAALAAPLLRVTPADADVATFTTAIPPEAVLDEVERHLAEPRSGLRRWRIRRSDDAAPQIAAESGLWSREGGSLAFHLSFYVLLAAIVFGQLLTFEGQRGVIEGEPGFTDTAVSYWMYAPGRWFPEERHAGWQLDLEEFEVDWIRDPLAPGAGQPTLFRSAVSITGRDGSVERGIVEGNRPLVVDGRKIHQLDWGYAPRIVVRQDGVVVHDGWANTQANTQGIFTGAIKVPSATPDVGLELFLYPFAPEGPEGPRLTGAPWADAPLLFVLQWRGDLQLGLTQQFINELDVSALDLEGGATLRPGERVQLGDVEVEFVELRRWVGFQVSSRPQVPWLLAGSAMLSVGLITALYAYRRRLWVLVEEAPSEAASAEEGSAAGTRTLVTVVGRAFQRPDAATEEHARIVAELTERLSKLEGGQPSGQPQHEGAHP
jgi:cytochrome c biogenesis protein